MTDAEKFLLIALFGWLIFKSFVKTEVTATIREFKVIDGGVVGPLPPQV